MLCVTKGRLATYKLFARTYGGKSDTDLDGAHDNTLLTAKWINFFSHMLDPFKGLGCNVMMDSAYMGDTMALIGHFEWEMNMYGTTQTNRTGALAGNWKKSPDLKVGYYESVCW